ncbi:MAG: MFS transporter [Clostridia bacterium]|nr:MFS transporter [Clostridia bacterium]
MKTRISHENPLRITLLMMMLYAFSNGVQYIGYNHIPLFISAQSFADDSTIGYATAIGAVSTIIAQLFWGRISDRSSSKNMVLVIALLGMSLTSLFFWQDMPSARFLYCVMPVFYFFFLAPQSMSDTICIENIEKTGKPFAFIRSAAPFFSTFLAFLMFILPNLSVKSMIMIYTFCPLLAILPAVLLPKTEGHFRKNAADKNANHSMLSLLKNKKMLLLLAFGFFGFTFGNIPTTYFSVYYSTPRGLNAGTSMLGLFFVLSIAMECLVLIFSGRLIKKVHPFLILGYLLLWNAVRMFLIYIIQNPYLMLVTALFQSIWFGLIFSTATPLINSIVAPELKATGQSVWVLTAFGISQILGNLLAGVLADFLSMRQIFLVAAVGFIVLFCTLGPMLLHSGHAEMKKAFPEREA